MRTGLSFMVKLLQYEILLKKAKGDLKLVEKNITDPEIND